MLFSAKSEYACIAMLELAVRYGERKPVSLADLAEQYKIPQRFMVQIFVELKKAGLVATTRGPLGGYQITRNPDSVTLAEIIELFDTMPLTSGARAGAVETPPYAALREKWNESVQAMRATLAEATLGELVRTGHALEYVI